VAEEEQEEAEAAEAAEVALRAEVVAEGVTGGVSEGAVEVVADFVVVVVAASGGGAEAEAGFRCRSLIVMIGNSGPDQIKPLVILCLTYTAPPFKLYSCHSPCSLMPCTSISTMLSNWKAVLPVGLTCVGVVVAVLLGQIHCGHNLASHGINISSTPQCSCLVVLSFCFLP